MRPPRRHSSRQPPATSSSGPRRSPRLAADGAPPRDSPEKYLPEALTEKILLHLRPDDPAGLAKACVASKNWCHYISSPWFLRHYRALHPTPPLLGFLGNTGKRAISTSFVLTSTFHLKPRSVPRYYNALDARNGRVLFHDGTSLVIWEPMRKKKHVACMPIDEQIVDHWNAVLLCGRYGCDNIMCGHHDDESIVVFVSTSHEMQTLAKKYSTEIDEWHDEYLEVDPTYIIHPDAIVDTGPSVVLGNTVYFPCTLRTRLIEYDHHEEELKVIDAPEFVYRGIRSTILLTARDGVLGFAGLASSKLHLWSREVTGPGKASTWVQYKVLDLATMPRIPRLVGSIDGHIFIKTGDGVFNVKLDSGNAEKVSTSRRINKVIPYTAFCTPSAGSII